MVPELILLFPQNHGLFESAFRPVMAFLETVGRDNTTTVSRMTKTMKDEHVVAMGLDYDTETRLRLALEKTTQAVLIEVRGRADTAHIEKSSERPCWNHLDYPTVCLSWFLQESEPLQIRKLDVDIEIWSGLTRRGVWKGGRIVVKKFSKKDVTAARLEEMLRDTVLFSEISHPNIVKVGPWC
jgi:hypothetical protein